MQVFFDAFYEDVIVRPGDDERFEAAFNSTLESLGYDSMDIICVVVHKSFSGTLLVTVRLVNDTIANDLRQEVEAGQVQVDFDGKTLSSSSGDPHNRNTTKKSTQSTVALVGYAGNLHNTALTNDRIISGVVVVVLLVWLALTKLKNRIEVNPNPCDTT